MTVSPAERQLILSQIGKLAEQDIATLWRQATALPSGEFAAFVIEAFPEVIDPFAALAADTAAVWYEDSPSTSDYVPTAGPLPVAEQLQASATWALGANGIEGLARLQGTTQRAVFDAARDTVLHNVDSESGAKWARHASANACAFCALMASRGAVYTSKAAAERVVGRGKEMSLAERRIRAAGGTRIGGHTAAGGIRERGVQKLGKKYHDHCHCIAVEVRPGQSYQPPDYVQKWDEAYIVASRETPKVGKYDAIDPTAVLAHMRASLGTH
ncbi:VG15 protein [Nocardia sp. NPDC004750]